MSKSNKAQIGASIVLDGEKEFKSAVTDCNKSLGTMRSELGKVKEEYTGNANSLEALRAKHDTLSKVLEAQNSKLDAVRAGYEHARASQDKVGNGLTTLKQQYETARTKMDQMRTSGTATDKELEDQKKTVDDLAAAVAKGEKNYQTATNRVQDWQTKLNTAETQTIKANRELKTNDQYMEEASRSTNKCATSIDQYGKELNSAKSETSTFGSVLKANLTGQAIVSGVRALGSALKEVGESAVEATRSAASYADDINTLSTQTGISTDSLQELKYMEDLVDVSLDTVTSSMAKNIKSMSSAKKGSADYVAAYKELNVATTDANGNFRDSEDVYWDVIDALGDVKNETERNTLSMQLFGKKAQDLNPLIAQGAEGINAMKEEAKDMGAVLSSDTLASLNETNDQFDRMTQRADILKREIGAELAPGILEAASEIGEALQENKDELLNLAEDGIDVVSDGLKWLLNHSDSVVISVKAMAMAFVSLKAAATTTSALSGLKEITATTGALSSLSGIAPALSACAIPAGVLIGSLGLVAAGTYAWTEATYKQNVELQTSLKTHDDYIKKLSDERSEISQNLQTTKDSMTASQADVASVETQANRLMALNKVQDKTKAQKHEMKALVESLSETAMPNLNKQYDEESGKLSLTNAEIKKKIKNYKQLYLTQAAEKEIKEAYQAQYDAEKNLNSSKKERTKLQKQLNKAIQEESDAQLRLKKTEITDDNGNLIGRTDDYEAATEAVEKTGDAVAGYRDELDKSNREISENKKLLKESKDTAQEASDYIDKLSGSQKKLAKETNTATKSLKKSGKNSVEGMIDGAESKKKDLIDTYSGLGTAAVKAYNKSLDIHSPSRVMKKSGIHTVEGLIEGLESKKKAVKKKANELAESVIDIYQNKIDMVDLATNGNGYDAATITKYWKKIVDATKKGTSAHTDALKSYYTARNELINSQKEKLSTYSSSYKSTVAQLKSDIADLQQTYNDSVSSTADSISGSLSLFDKASVTKTNDATGLLSNLRSQVNLISAWRTNLQKLRDRGVSNTLITELQNLGVSSAGDIETLANMSDDQLSEYQSLYSQKETQSTDEAVTQNSALKTSTDTEINALIAQAKKDLKKLLKTYRAEMKALGKNASEGFADGIIAKSESVYKAIATMTGQTVKDVKKNLGIHSPSKVMAELGGYTGMGFAQGLQKETQDLSDIITGALPTSVDAPSVSGAASASSTASQTATKVNLNIIMDSKTIGTAVFSTVDSIQTVNARLNGRGLVTNG